MIYGKGEPSDERPAEPALTHSWSPDGAFIAASNAMNGPVFVASVIERGEAKDERGDMWNAEISFVGHDSTIQVAVSCMALQELLKLTCRRSTPDCSSIPRRAPRERRLRVCSPSAQTTIASRSGGTQCTSRLWWSRICLRTLCTICAGESHPSTAPLPRSPPDLRSVPQRSGKSCPKEAMAHFQGERRTPPVLLLARWHHCSLHIRTDRAARHR